MALTKTSSGVMGTDSVASDNITASSVTTAKVADDAVTLAKMAAGTDGELITYDASGDPATVPVGTATHVLTSNGAGVPPTFQSGAASAATKEEWFPVLALNLTGGANTFPYTSYGGTPGSRRFAAAPPHATGSVYLNMYLPLDFTSVTSLNLIIVPNTTETIQADIDSEYGSVGEARNTHTGTLVNETLAVTADEITEWDIKSVISSAVAGDHVGIQVASDTAEILITGMRLKYT